MHFGCLIDFEWALFLSSNLWLFSRIENFFKWFDQTTSSVKQKASCRIFHSRFSFFKNLFVPVQSPNCFNLHARFYYHWIIYLGLIFPTDTVRTSLGFVAQRTANLKNKHIPIFSPTHWFPDFSFPDFWTSCSVLSGIHFLSCPTTCSKNQSNEWQVWRKYFCSFINQNFFNQKNSSQSDCGYDIELRSLIKKSPEHKKRK